jgi:hypothetical protein
MARHSTILLAAVAEGPEKHIFMIDSHTNKPMTLLSETNWTAGTYQALHPTKTLILSLTSIGSCF